MGSGGAGACAPRGPVPPRRGVRASLRRGAAVAAAGGSGGSSGAPDPYEVLQVPRGAGRRAIRAAYIQRIKRLHPDVAAEGEGSTAAAAALNAAYEALAGGFASASRDDSGEEGGGEEWDPLAVFDLPEAEPDRLFVDPFACANVAPWQWEALQAAAGAAEAAGRDPWAALREQGVVCGEGALHYLSPRQAALLGEELERACAVPDPSALEAASYFVADCLARARLANRRVPA